ncbi:unnamed protein product [Phytophthora fragariaefolia]|uniref:Unnamed protein product n=1 Tax=Phytophthora fragariaefolia TaxID=1490495 RepID=A0A9W6YDH8_9STRA|nr:unnamed protein product [Phytophthora fragariaefolia]
MKKVVLRFGPFREILTDGAPELTGQVIDELVMMLQSEKTNPVPYRLQMIGLVERFHITWKDMVSIYMQNDKQNDWDTWVDFAVYSYNSGRPSTVGLSPNELIMYRRLRAQNELLLTTYVTEAGDLTEHHRRMLTALESSYECAERAREREQARQANTTIWIGPLRVVEPAGYDNFLLEREDQNGKAEQFLAHVSFLISYHYPTDLLRRVAADLEAQIAIENSDENEDDEPTTGTITRATAAAVHATTGVSGSKRNRQAVESENAWGDTGGKLVELRRRRRLSLVTSNGECPWRSMNGSSLPAESWKTLKGRKACNRYGVPSTADDETSAEKSIDVDGKAYVETLKYCENMRDARSMQ